MTDKNDALFLVRLPFGQKTIPYEEVSELIAMAKSPGYDIEKASGDEDVIFVLGVGLEERKLRAAIQAGEVEVLSNSLHRMEPPFMGRLENTLLTVRALREYVESIHGFLEVQDAPKQADTQPQTAPVVQAPESPQQRQDRRLKACIDAGLPMNDKAALIRLPDGVGNVAASECVTRQTFSIDVKAALKRREAITKPARVVRHT